MVLRPAARQALVEFGPAAFEGLIATLKDDNFETRSIAAEFLGNLKDRRAVGPLVAALKDAYRPDTAIDALVKLRAPAVEPLLAKLKDLDPYVREYAATALGRIKDVRAVEPLVAALKDSAPHVRNAAARAFVDGITDPRAVAPLIAALKDPDWTVREGAALALAQAQERRGGGAGDCGPRRHQSACPRSGGPGARWYPGRSRRRTVARRLERP